MKYIIYLCVLIYRILKESNEKELLNILGRQPIYVLSNHIGK